MAVFVRQPSFFNGEADGIRGCGAITVVHVASLALQCAENHHRRNAARLMIARGATPKNGEAVFRLIEIVAKTPLIMAAPVSPDAAHARRRKSGSRAGS